jgi:HD-GYP domain-containing protein (c-di-GMP phosphodiesterase class II)
MRPNSRRPNSEPTAEVLQKISALLAEFRIPASKETITARILDVVLECIPADAAVCQVSVPAKRQKAVLQARGRWSFLSGDSSAEKTISARESAQPLDDVRLTAALFEGRSHAVSICESALRARGRTLGFIRLGRAAPRSTDFSREERDLLALFADLAAAAILPLGLSDQLEMQQAQISAARSVERAIASSLDLSLTLSVFLDHATAQLNADAAAVILPALSGRDPTMAAARGFRNTNRPVAHLRMDHPLASQAGVGRKTVSIEGSGPTDPRLENQPLMRSEEFAAYFATPLIAHGKVNGVLEIFQRSTQIRDPEWLELLESIAVQGALVIDNAESFQNLQRTHSELAHVCDSTIEGWARAIDLKVQEADGHGLRISELTVRLAEKFGIPVEQLLSIRRGALLHDIGKIGIPDRILWKPDRLSDEEWTLMREHPKYAERLLAPIEFLHSAMDIPKFHHERWDGRGYPYGLSGTDIPLPARLFSIVDVWDSLQARRPFRQPWSPADAVEYLQKESGSQFDPDAVHAFLGILQEPEQ